MLLFQHLADLTIMSPSASTSSQYFPLVGDDDCYSSAAPAARCPPFFFCLKLSTSLSSSFHSTLNLSSNSAENGLVHEVDLCVIFLLDIGTFVTFIFPAELNSKLQMYHSSQSEPTIPIPSNLGLPLSNCLLHRHEGLLVHLTVNLLFGVIHMARGVV